MQRNPDPSAPARRVFVLALALSASLETAPGQSVLRVSKSSSGVEGNGGSAGIVLSADGRLAAFQSFADNLVPGDTNGLLDVFVHDLVLGTTERVSVGPMGIEGDGESSRPSISADGRFVAFQSDARNLVVLDQNFATDVFVHDRVTGVTERVSVSLLGLDASDASSGPSISADGRCVAFQSAANDIVPNDSAGMTDVFVRDRLQGTTELMSRSASGAFGDSDSWRATISADGSRVAFQSLATNLVPGDSNGFSDVFVVERPGGMIRRASIASNGAEANGMSETPSLSAEGRFVAFGSYATNLDASNTNASFDVFLHDLATGVTERVSRSLSASPNAGWSQAPSISADGRRIAFRSHAEDLVQEDSNGHADVFGFDRWTGALELVARGSDGDAAEPYLSADGRRVAFASAGTNLVADDQNGERDVFVVDLEAARSSYCHGDGLDPATTTACPCGNFGAAGHGCANSSDIRGGLLGVSGVPAADEARLHAARVPFTAPAVYLQGDGSADAVFGDGIRCTGGTLLRLRTRASVAGASSFPDTTDTVTLADRGGVTPGSGVRRYYQVYYRNSAPLFCPPATFNVTNGMIIDW